MLKKKQLFNRQIADYQLGLVIFGLMVFGVVMIYSSSVFVGERYFGDPTIFFKRQIISLIIAFAVWMVFQQIDYHLLKKYSSHILIFTFILLLIVFIFPEKGGSQSWIMIGSWQFQPSESLKLSIIIYLACWLEKKDELIKKLNQGFFPFLALLVIISILIVLQPDIGTLIIILIIAISMYFFANAPLFHFGLGSIFAGLGFYFLIWQSNYRRERIMTFLNPTIGKLESAYHIQNIFIAIGSGGFWGLGFGESRQKRLFLPEPHTDSIFAVIVEELGFMRSFLVILAILFIIIRIFRLSFKAPDKFGSLIAGGIAIWIAFQSIVNLGAMLGLMPLTGIPLPFISYGGSSLIVLGAATGILMNISKQVKRE